MKVTVEKELNLPELIEYVYENDVVDRIFRTTDDIPWERVIVNPYGVTSVQNVGRNRKFKVIVEEDITMNTKLQGIQEVWVDEYGDIDVYKHGKAGPISISDILLCSDKPSSILAIFFEEQLVWTHGYGLVTGVNE